MDTIDKKFQENPLIMKCIRDTETHLTLGKIYIIHNYFYDNGYLFSIQVKDDYDLVSSYYELDIRETFEDITIKYNRNKNIDFILN